MTEAGRVWRVCAIAGSLRKSSYNRVILKAAEELAPDDLAIELFDRIDDVPLFNQDVEADGDPPGVAALKDAIRRADGLLVATPEYNSGVPGVLKNALDWASRKGTDPASALAGKPAAVLGASPGRLGTARAQPQLRQALAGSGAIVMPRPEVHLMGIAAHVTDGVLVDEPARQVIASLLEAFARWIPQTQA
jgi:chromate reductase, NAD(P)H dehydrogenase (quinone)